MDTEVTLRSCQATHVGHVRSRNEDALLADPERGLFVVCDGLGGHPAGDVASRVATEVVDRRLSADALAGSVDRLGQLTDALRAANRELLGRQRDDGSLRGMGTTAVVAHVDDDGRTASLAHVGDSRAYVLTPEGLRQVTTDHVRSGILGRTLWQALGTEAQVDPDAAEIELVPGGALLLCTDGLTDMLTDDEIEDVLRDTDAGAGACRALVDRALERGGVDNVTVVVVSVG